jgi:valyl-tRNA synthetase
MTITPWHSAVDFEIAERHNLDKEQIIDERGKLLPIAGECAGMKIAEARAKIVEKLRSKGLVVKEEPYTHNVATAERTGGIIEPQIKLQWFVDVRKEIPGRGKTLKDLMRDPVKKGEITIIPDHFVKTYDHWIEHLQDWCISRQIWYGHQVPVWYKGTEIYTGIEDPEGEGWEQDPDTLDTWFSSALWTFSTLGWPEKTEDLQIYHPTDVLETGYEILFFWIARMILMTEYALGTIPFHTVYLHGTVRDAQGRKMSKSLGNGIDPIAMATKFGADASRMALVVGNTPGTDSRISEDKIKGYKHFANKLWNIARFVLGKAGETATGIPEAKTEADKAILDALKETETQTKEAMERYEFHEASQMLYHFAWHTFADVYLEASKKQDDARTTEILHYVLTRTLILLHPFMPFVTEAIWEHIHPDRLLMTESW